jgi:hypothetical protein
MTRPTVRELLDGLAEGRFTLEEVAADFTARVWPPLPPRPTLAQAYGVHDDEAVTDPDSWKLVETDPRLSGAQYDALFFAAGPQTRQQEGDTDE